MMLSLLLILACGDSTPETTDAPKVEATVGDGTMQNGAPDAPTVEDRMGNPGPWALMPVGKWVVK